MAEREWREASDMRSPKAAVLLVLGCAAVLRFWSLGHGIPYVVGVDEPAIMSTVVRMMRTGDFNPHFFDYPGLYIYLQLLTACARFISGAMDGLWRSLNQADMSDFYLWGRAVTAMFGTATVFLVFQIGMRWGTRHALLAAGLMAVMPMHVRESHYALTDVPMTFFVTLAFLLSLRAHEHQTARAFFWAGVAVGLATATKYNGAVALVLPLVAAWMTLDARPSRLACTLAAVGGCCAAFLLGAPYTLIDLPGFLNGFANLSAAYNPERNLVEPGWLIYLKHLRLGFGWPASILAASGLVLAIVRAAKGPGRVRWTLLLAFPILYFPFIATKTLIFGRYLLPIVPFVCLLIATTVVSGVSLLRRFNIPRAARTALIAGLTIAVLLPPAVTAVRFNRSISQPSTQAAAYRWIEENVPRRSRVAVENFVVQLPQTKYRSEQVTVLTEMPPEDYGAKGFEYIVASGQMYGPVLNDPQRYPRRSQAYQKLFDQLTEVQAFRPSEGIVGPEIRIFRVVSDR